MTVREGRDALSGAAIAARNWPVTLSIVALIVGGVELRMTLADVVGDLHAHVAQPGHNDAERRMAVADSQAQRVEQRLAQLERGQHEMARELTEAGATATLVLEELREMRREMKR